MREHNDRMTQAYYTAVIPMMKKPPKLNDLLVDVRPTKATWQQIKAALLFAMPPPTNQQHNPE